MSKTKLMVYIAGPLTGGDQLENISKAISMGQELIDAGFHAHVPHLSALWHIMHQNHYEVWMELDFNMLLRCDAVLRIPGHSPGADREVAFALHNGVPVYYSMQELIKDQDELRALVEPVDTVNTD